MKQLCYTERRVFIPFQSSDADQQETYKSQKSSDRLQTSKCENSKNNLAYPLLKDMFSVLGSSKCEVLSVLDVKDIFHYLRLSEHSKKYCEIIPYFGSASYLFQGMPMGLNISPENGKPTSMQF